MAFDFHNLDDPTRRLMLSEVDLDESTTVYLGLRLNPAGAQAWLGLLREACAEGDETTLAAALGDPGGLYLDAFEVNPSTGIADRHVRKDAGSLLGAGEFNRFYMRALCLRAAEDGRDLAIYRARMSAKPSESSQKKIGNRVDPTELLEDLRANKGAETVHGLGAPNSGLSVELV